MLLTKEKLLEHRLRWELVPVPGADGEEVGIRALPYPVLQKAAELGESNERYAPYMLAHCLVDESGALLFKDEAEASEAAKTIDPVIVDFILAKALMISSPNDAQREAIKKSFKIQDTETSGE